MKRIDPDNRLIDYPCCVVAVTTAIGYDNAINRAAQSHSWFPQMDATGYVTLSEANRFIRRNLQIKKKD